MVSPATVTLASAVDAVFVRGGGGRAVAGYLWRGLGRGTGAVRQCAVFAVLLHGVCRKRRAAFSRNGLDRCRRLGERLASTALDGFAPENFGFDQELLAFGQGGAIGLGLVQLAEQVAGVIPLGVAVFSIVRIHHGAFQALSRCLLAVAATVLGDPLPGHVGLAVEHGGFIPAFGFSGVLGEVVDGDGVFPDLITGRASGEHPGIFRACFPGGPQAALCPFLVSGTAGGAGALPSVFCLGEQFVHRLQILVFAPCRADLNIGRKGRIQTRLAGR